MTGRSPFPSVPDNFYDRLEAGCGLVLQVPLTEPVGPDTLTGLSPEERDRAKRFRHAPSRQAFVTGRTFLRQLLARNEPPESVPIRLGSHGKPSCELKNSPHFNLSHTRGWLSLAFTYHGPVGVDVETLERTTSADRIARRVFSDGEQAALRKGQPESFMRLWTRKEAWSKATGLGFSSGFAQFDTLSSESRGEWTFQEFHPDATSIGCVALPGKAPLFQLLRWDPVLQKWL